MTAAISNIAWDAAEEVAIAGVLKAAGADAVEIAPTRRWPTPLTATAAEIEAYRELWASQGLPVVALQALLFGREDLRIFADAGARQQTTLYLERMIGLGAALGAKVLVFGSPRNRTVGALSAIEVERVAVPFFSHLGDIAHGAGVSFCIEPNPPQYACDWLTDTSAAVAFLELVGSPGLGLHLDAAALTLNDEVVPGAFELAAPWLRHFHVSEPYLAALDDQASPRHAQYAEALQRIGYGRNISIEMRASADQGDTHRRVLSALAFVRHQYSGLLSPRRPGTNRPA